MALLRNRTQFVIIHPLYDLHRDEYLYLAEANHLAFGFVEVPPLISIVAYIIQLLGNSVFLVKLFPALCGAAMIAIAWKITEEIGGGLYPQILVAFALIFSAFLRINMLFQPNSFDSLCWTLLFYLLIRWINTQQTKYLYYFAVTVALTLLNKYNVIFLLAAFVIALILSPYRKLFLQKHFYAALFLLLILIFPNIIWQIQHGVPFFHHMTALSEEQLKNVNAADFLMDQFLFFIGAVYVVIAGFLSVFSKHNKKFRIVFVTIFITFLLYIWFKAKGYYAIGLYPVLLAFGAVTLERMMSAWKPVVGTTLKLIMLVIPFALMCFAWTITFPVLAPESIARNNKKFEKLGLLRWEDGENHTLPQDFADMLGWKELTEKTQKIWNVIPDKEKPNTIIITDNYGQAGAINYYSNGKITAHSSEASFAYWLPQDIKIKNVITIGEASDSSVLLYFKHSVKADSITHLYAREYGTGIYVLYNADTSFCTKFWLPYVKDRQDYYRYYKK